MSDLRADGFACRYQVPDACREPLVLLGSRPVAVPGRVDGRRREAAGRHVAVGAGHQAPDLLVPAAALGQQHQGAAAGGIGGRPEHTGEVVDGEETFRDPFEVVCEVRCIASSPFGMPAGAPAASYVR